MAFTRDEFGRKILNVDLESVGGAPFRMRLFARIFGETRVAEIASMPLQQSRNRALIADGEEGIGVVIPLRGRYVAGHDGALYPFAAGDLMIMSSEKQGVVACPRGGAFLTIVAARKDLLPRLKEKNLDFGTPRRNCAQSLTLLHSYLAFVSRSSMAATAEMRAVMGHQIVELLALALGATDEAAANAESASLMSARLAMITAEIDAKFADPWFSVTSLAASMGVSVRYVQVLLQREGTSFGEEVKRRRLDHARRLLLDPARHDRRIMDIALDCGFNDVGHFNRVFRTAFGDSPSGVRRS